MKKLFSLIALGSFALVSADQYYQPYGNNQSYGAGSCPSCNNGGYYQNEYNGNYYQQNQRQNSQGNYYQRDDRNYPRNNQYNYQQQSPGNQSYDQNQQYYQQRGNQSNNSYDRDQQRNNDNTYSQNGDNQRTVSNQEINKKIEDTLSGGWFSKGFQNVSFDVNNGNVNLRGSVDSLENKNKIEDSVRKIDGVRQVNNQITIAKEDANSYSDSDSQNYQKKYSQDFASTSQDRELNAKIRDKLSGWFSKGYDKLVIRTTNGVVVISGTVDKPEDVQKINDQIKNIEGVRTVNNQLTVKNR